MKIRLLKPYGFCASGTIMDPPAPIASQLIARRVAEKVADDSRQSMAISAPENAALPKAARRKAVTR